MKHDFTLADQEWVGPWF